MPEQTESYRRCKDVRFRMVQGEGVVIRQESGEALILNGVGARIFELAAAGEPAAQIVTTLAEEYDADDQQLRSDVNIFLGEMRGAGLIEPDEESG